MTRLSSVIATNVFARVGILLVIGLIVASFFVPGAHIATLVAKFLYHFGLAIVVGAAAGWLAYSVSVWWKTTLIVAILTSALQLGSIYLLP